MYNYKNGTVEITGGTIASGETKGYASISFGVHNKRDGRVSISGGSVSAGASGGNSYGVLNENSGTVKITGGTIKSGSVSGNVPSAAISNDADGKVIISGTPSITAGSSTSSNSYGVWNYGSGDVLISGSPTIAGGTAGSGMVSASFRVQTADTSAITLENGFAPASGTPYSVYIGTADTSSAGIFAKPGTGATLDASWFTSYDASKFTVEKVGDNLELKAVTQ